MKKFITGPRGFVAVIVIMGLTFTLAGFSEARFKAIIDGITVVYSNDGADAYYDPDDGTLTVAVTQNYGNLKITVGRDAYLFWGDYVDIYILADNASLNSIKIKGSYDCVPYIAGQVGYVDAFTLLNGVVGDTIFYGRDYGLGMVSDYIPRKIVLKYSYATAQVFGYAYMSANAVAGAAD